MFISGKQVWTWIRRHKWVPFIRRGREHQN